MVAWGVRKCRARRCASDDDGDDDDDDDDGPQIARSRVCPPRDSNDQS